MSDVDTSAETVERLAVLVSSVNCYTLMQNAEQIEATLRALAAERDDYKRLAYSAQTIRDAATADCDRLAAENARLLEALRGASHEAAGAEDIENANVLARRLMRIQIAARAVLGDKP